MRTQEYLAGTLHRRTVQLLVAESVWRLSSQRVALLELELSSPLVLLEDLLREEAPLSYLSRLHLLSDAAGEDMLLLLLLVQVAW
jgi:hypothetical protein